MRRTLAPRLVAVSALLASCLAAAGPLAPAATADGSAPTTVTAGLAGLTQGLASAPATSAPYAEAALDSVRGLLTGSSAARGAQASATSGETTLALRDLAVALPDLDAADRRTAEQVLARPTDGGSDPLGQGYTTKSKKKCGGNFCVHYVTSTSDQADPSWVTKTLSTMNKVWKKEVKNLGYRKPLSDAKLSGNNGGNGKFDVYLKQLGNQGLYGYCTTEFVKVKNGKRTRQGGGYCVLDNDFSQSEFGAKPIDSMKVTAAHEFFHAVQFAYDYTEDGWFMESTATWMEERVADDVNDNRQYLPASQVKEPGTPLDLFNDSGVEQYGNWVWWEFLSDKYGNGFVQKVWEKAAGSSYSTKALSNALKAKKGFTRTYADFAAANLTPARSYPEGKAWPSPATKGNWTLTKTSPSASGSSSVDHMASSSFAFAPDASLDGASWRAKVTVDGPGRSSDPTAIVVVRNLKGGWSTKVVSLNKSGKGSVTIPFSAKKVRSATVTLVNASTRFRCDNSNYAYSCGGQPKDDGKGFSLAVAAVKKK